MRYLVRYTEPGYRSLLGVILHALVPSFADINPVTMSPGCDFLAEIDYGISYLAVLFLGSSFGLGPIKVS